MPVSVFASNPFVVKLIDDWNKGGFIEVQGIPYIQDTVLNLKKTSIYSKDDERVDSSNEQGDQSNWFDSLYSSQKKDYDKAAAEMRAEFKNTIIDQKRKYIDVYLRWREAYKAYKKEEAGYKKNLVDYEKLEPKNDVVIKYRKTTEDLPYKVVDKAFDIAIKDQGKRPTCASFAAVYAIEVKRAQKGSTSSLSEQYFYWASKPKCQNKKCSTRGSWVIAGLEKSKKSKRQDIPSAASCPYTKVDKKHNQTQIPLSSSCTNAGLAKVVEYTYLKDSSHIRDEINRNNPVVIAVKLSPNFYGRNSFVSYTKSLQNGKTDSHASGHALTVVGYVENPKKLRSSEGKYCYIVANSWGEGWGQGGHSCISDKWLSKYRLKNDYVAIEKVI